MGRNRNVLRGLFLAFGRALLDGGPGTLFRRGPRDAPPRGNRKGEAADEETDAGTPLPSADDEVVTTPLFPRDDARPFPARLSETIAKMREVWGGAADLVVRRVALADGRGAALFFFKGLVDDQRLDLSVVRPLQSLVPRNGQAAPGGRGSEASDESLHRLLTALEERVVHAVDLEPVSSFAEGVDRIARGFALLAVEGERTAVAISVQQRQHRAVAEPGTEPVIRGPREGFIEELDTNVALVRSRVRHPGLRFLAYRLGRYSQTRMFALYVEGRTPPELVEEMKRRLGRIEIDAVVESSYIEELIEDVPYSPFPQVLSTERPDVAAAALYEGRMVLLTDGTPFALIAPATFWTFLQASEDYYHHYTIGTFLRALRIALVVVSVTLPALYIAAVIFHPGMLPTPLLITIAASRERVPLPAALEVFLFELAFEAFREAGVRLPRPVGQTVSIVGGIIIGQAAVQAGLISAPVVVVVALTGIASFSAPHTSIAESMRLLRFFLIVMASAYGLYGILIGGGFIQMHLLAMRSFGVPYMWPVAPLDLKALKDIFVRAPMGRRENSPMPVPGRDGSGGTR